MSICQMLGILLVMSVKNQAHADEVHPQSGSRYVRVTGDDVEDERSHWDSLFNTTAYVYGTDPTPFLKESIKYLPNGRTLDLACSEGRNSVFLAKKGFDVTAVDYSEVALRKARRLAHENRVSIKTVNADLTDYTIKPETYDVIVSIEFLLRSLIPQIKRGLKHGGVVVYQAETEEQLKNEIGKASTHREPLLKHNELKEIFKDFEILVYHEGNDGKDAVASLIARKP